MRVEIHVDGGPGLGFGHISRMRTLASDLGAAGDAIIWRPGSELAASALPPAAPGPADIVLVDLPYDGSKVVAAARERGLPVAVLDHLGPGRADLVIRTNAPPQPAAATRLVYGLEYALIRPEVRAASSSSGGAALVAVGGSDHGERGPLAAARLAASGLPVVLARGPIAGPLEGSPAGVDVRIDPPDFVALMAAAPFAVANAGTTLMELLCLGKAVHVLPQTEEEERFAAELLADGAILGIGLEALARPDQDRIRAVERASAGRVDARGGARIRTLLAELIASDRDET